MNIWTEFDNLVKALAGKKCYIFGKSDMLIRAKTISGVTEEYVLLQDGGFIRKTEVLSIVPASEEEAGGKDTQSSEERKENVHS